MSTDSTNVFVKVSRDEAIRAGFNGTDSVVELAVNVTKLSQQDREEFASRLSFSSSYAQHCGVPLNKPYLRGHNSEGKLTTSPIVLAKPTVDGLLDVFREYRLIPARLEAERQANIAAATEAAKELLAKAPEGCVKSADLYICTEGQIHDYLYKNILGKITYTYTDYSVSAYCSPNTPAELAEKIRERAAEYAAGNKGVKEAARDQAAKDLYSQYWQSRLDWIAEHGSQSLRRMVEENMSWNAVYVEEHVDWEHQMFTARLTTERPGWVHFDEPDRIQTPKRPKVRAWAMLDAARGVEPTAKLGVLDKKYVAYAEFLGRTIICRA